MTTLAAMITAGIAGLLGGTADIGDVSHKVNYAPGYPFTSGVGANQADKMFADTRTLVAAATENLDLSGGLNDVFGNALVFTKVRALLIRAAAGNTNDVIVGGLNAGAFGVISLFGVDPSSLKIKPGGMALLVAPDVNGYAVAAGTGDLLKVANSAAGTSVSYDIVIIGT